MSVKGVFLEPVPLDSVVFQIYDKVFNSKLVALYKTAYTEVVSGTHVDGGEWREEAYFHGTGHCGCLDKRIANSENGRILSHTWCGNASCATQGIINHGHLITKCMSTVPGHYFSPLLKKPMEFAREKSQRHRHMALFVCKARNVSYQDNLGAICRVASDKDILPYYLAIPFLSMRTMATKTIVIKSKGVTANAAKSASARVASTSKTVASNSPVYSKSDFSTTRTSSSPSTITPSPVSAAAATPGSGTTPSFYKDEGDDSSTVSKVGGESSQGANGGAVFSTGGWTLKDAAIGELGTEDSQDWTRSFSGMAIEPFEKEVAELLMKPLDPEDIEIKPDGILYLPEIKYRRILNKAFGPGGWGLAPRSEHSITPKSISREYALICRGRFVSTARGEQDYFDPNNLPTASEGCKSNALMRCCKDLGIASELWDPSFIRKFKKQYCEEHFAEHVVTKRKKRLWKRKDQPDFEYPYCKAK
ncbi:hypothetical protein EDD11_001028 [Mortierella claussenii]|nr:hypothetical protein EDD11_001028 [Mortierella claussenii]